MYKPGTSLMLPIQSRSAFVCLDGNTCPYEPAPKVRAAVMEALSAGWMKEYPEYQEIQLIERASEFYGVPSTCVAVTVGVDHAINYLARFAEGWLIEHEAVTYGGFLKQIKRIEHVTVSKPPFSNRLTGFNFESNLVYIANPNNPTGILYNREEILWMLGRKDWVVVDESYMDWAGTNQSCVHLIPGQRGLIVLRGFSKAFGLAGMRVGLMIAHPDFIETYKDTFDCRLINTLTQIAAETALDNYDYVKREMELAKIVKEETLDTLKKNGIRAFGTDTNFIVIKDDEAAEIQAELDSRHRILTRTFDDWPGYLRVSVGSAADMKRFCDKYMEMKNRPEKSSGEAAIPQTDSQGSEVSR